MSKNLVVDTSVVIKWLNQINEQGLAQAYTLLDHIEKKQINVSAPTLLKYEIGNALLRGKQLKTPEAIDALNAFYKLPLNLVDIDEDRSQDIYRIAHGNNITFYDASFIMLAQELDCPLITANPKHQKRAINVDVIPLEKYI